MSLKRFFQPWFVGLFLLCGACASHPPAPPAVAADPIPDEGTDFDNAIVIIAKNELDGASAQYRWIKQHLEGFRPNGQSSKAIGSRSYDIVHTQSAKGKVRDVYFDITSFARLSKFPPQSE